MSQLHKRIFALLTGQGDAQLLAGLDELLAGDAIVTLNGLASGHVYPLVAPKDAPLPYVVYSVSGNSEGTFCGAGPKHCSVDVSCWAATLQVALEMRDAAIAALEGIAEGEYSEFEDHDEQTGGYRAGVELHVWL